MLLGHPPDIPLEPIVPGPTNIQKFRQSADYACETGSWKSCFIKCHEIAVSIKRQTRVKFVDKKVNCRNIIEDCENKYKNS
jgi:hypothetical protein